MIKEMTRLRDLIADANRELADVHGATKDILASGLVDGLVHANVNLLEALRILASSVPAAPSPDDYWDCAKCGYYFQEPGPRDNPGRPTRCPNDQTLLVRRGVPATPATTEEK
jgi:hypothetical protein